MKEYSIKILAGILLLIPAGTAFAAGGQERLIKVMAPSPPPAPAKTKPSAPESCSLEGVVVSASVGQPLKRASVNLQRVGDVTGFVASNGVGPTQHQTRTDASGRFAFLSLDSGQYFLSVDRQGFLPKAYGQASPDEPGKTLELKPGDHKDGIVIRLMPTGVVSGHVYDEDGEPLSGAIVQAMEWHYVNGRRQLQQVVGSNTNDVGEYRLTGLRAQRYYVAAIYQLWAQGASDDGPAQSYVPAYYPGTPDPATAQPVDVRAGEETPLVDLTLMPVPAVRIRGQLTGHVPIGRQGVGFNLNLVRPEAGVYSTQQAQVNPADGTFEISEVPPGSYDLNAQVWDNGTNYFGRQRIEVGNSNLDGVNLVVGPGATIHGFIHPEGKLDFSLKGLQVSLLPRDQMQPGAQPATVQADGNFILTQVPDGQYDVQVCCLPAEDYLKVARLGGDDALDGGLNIRQADTKGSLELVLGGSAGEVDGVVLKEHQSFANATVVLVPDSNHRDRVWLYKTVNAAQDGSFSVQGIPPGDYEIFAWEKVEYGAWQDPDFLLAVEDRATPVRITEGSKLKVEIQVIAVPIE